MGVSFVLVVSLYMCINIVLETKKEWLKENQWDGMFLMKQWED